MPSRRLHTIASGSALNLMPTKVWKQEKEKLLVMLSNKITPFSSSNQGKTLLLRLNYYTPKMGGGGGGLGSNGFHIK